MRLFKKKSVYHRNAKNTKDSPVVKEQSKTVFELDFGQFMGQTVTVFVNAGGEVGKGFTGVLMGRTATYIKLLMLPASPPACSLGNSCRSGTQNILFCALCPFNMKATMGSMAIIPIINIAAFVHNTLSSKSPL